jgi:predicted secreted protein
MKIMDHDEAVRLQAAQKYLLGQLPKDEHAAYEEHYFDCSLCAEEIKATAAFMESVRQVAREQALQAIDTKRLTPVTRTNSNGGWFAWLKPAFAIPVMAALLLFIGYQNGVTIPGLKDSSSAPIISSSFQILGSVRGGSEDSDAANKVRVKQGESFLLKFDFTPAGTASEYSWQLLGPSGQAIRYGTLGGDKKYQTVSLPVVGGVQSAGKYSLVFFGDAKGNEAQRLTFTVEFLQ